MADMKITEYNSHNAPATGDQFFMIGASEEYRIDYDALASAILDKLTSKTYSDINNNVISAIAALNSRIAVTVTAGNNVTIDENKSYAVGKMLFLSVKGHASADVNNAEFFTISGGVTPNPTGYTFSCGLGAAWSLTGIGYCYINGNKVSGRLTSGQYFHICVTIPIN